MTFFSYLFYAIYRFKELVWSPTDVSILFLLYACNFFGFLRIISTKREMKRKGMEEWHQKHFETSFIMTQFYLYSLSFSCPSWLIWNIINSNLNWKCLSFCVFQKILWPWQKNIHTNMVIYYRTNLWIHFHSHTHTHTNISEILSVGLGFIWRFVATITLDSRKF